MYASSSASVPYRLCDGIFYLTFIPPYCQKDRNGTPVKCFSARARVCAWNVSPNCWHEIWDEFEAFKSNAFKVFFAVSACVPSHALLNHVGRVLICVWVLLSGEVGKNTKTVAHELHLKRWLKQDPGNKRSKIKMVKDRKNETRIKTEKKREYEKLSIKEGQNQFSMSILKGECARCSH